MKSSDPPEQTVWTKAALTTRLRELAAQSPVPQEPSAKPPVDPDLRAYREAAAVVSTFEPADLKPPGADEDASFTIILPDSQMELGNPRRWMLIPEVRASTLRRLVAEDRLGEAVRAAQAAEGDPLHGLLRRLAHSESWNPEEATEAELTAALELAKITEDGVPGLPEATAIRHALGRVRLLAPMRDLADEHFSGRRKELETLRNYVGVVDPKTWKGSIFRSVRNILSIEEQPPLMIFGPGGMGKSALVSRFVLEHADLEPSRRIPFAYLDFDRPGLTTREPLTLLAEILAQLVAQYPHLDEDAAPLRKVMRKHLSRAFRSKTGSRITRANSLAERTTSSSPGERREAIQQFAPLFQEVARANQPLLLVLDTFEEVQYHSRADIPELFDFLQQMQSAIPRLRVVLAGRSRETGRKVKPLPLEPLPEEEAVELLTSHGLENAAAEAITRHLGGNPLTLRLAMEVYRQEELGTEDLADLSGKKSFLSIFIRKVDEQRIQGQLYRRLLNHVADDEVRALAHPGLVLRRLTADLILRVLAEPCGLEIDGEDAATDLFQRLSQHDALVITDGQVIEHRNDVRRIMVDLIRKSDPERVEAIHRAAVAYYEPFDDPVSRAEEIYHRYCLEEDEEVIAGRWRPDLEDRLRSAIQEVPEAVRPHLASRLGVELQDDSDWEQADDDAWERHAAFRARQFIHHARYEDAVDILSQRSSRSGGSPLWNLEVVARTRLGELGNAWKLGHEALDAVRSAGARWEQLELLASLGSLAARRGEEPATQVRFFLDACRLALDLDQPVRAAELLLTAIQASPPDSAFDPEGEALLTSVLKRLAPHHLSAHTTLFAHLARQLDPRAPSLAARVRASVEPYTQGASSTDETVGEPSLSPEETQRLMLALGRHFKKEDDLEHFLADELDVHLREASDGGALSTVVFDLSNWVSQAGGAKRLVAALRRRFPKDKDLAVLADHLEDGA